MTLMFKLSTIAPRFAIVAAIFFTFASVARAADPVIWEVNTRAELLRGEARGVSVSDTGALTLAPATSEVFNTQQTFVWSCVLDARANVVLGTGHDGKIFRVGVDGKGALLYDAEELDVTALAAGLDGAVFAGTSPDGKVYKIDALGKAAVYFDPPDKYVWSLVVLPDGALAVGTGDAGKIYRVRTAGAKPEDALLADTAETNIVALAIDAKGQLVAGTDPNGVVLRVGADGKTFALYDSTLREMHALAPAPDGIYALALSDAAAKPDAPKPPDDKPSTPAAPPRVTSRYDLSGAKTAVFKLLPDGGAETVWKSDAVTGFALSWSRDNGLLLGTSDKGRVYRLADDGRDTLLAQTGEGQISCLATRGTEINAATSSQGKYYRLGPAQADTGVYESPVRDAKLPAAWGRVWQRSAGGVALETRSGNTETPDATWSEWAAPTAEGQVTSPTARFVQWRATLRNGILAPALYEVSLAYLPRNVAPEVLSLTVAPTGVSYPPTPVVTDPNVEASGLDPSVFGAAPPVSAPPRPTFQKGARSLRWQAEDRNGDRLEYAVYLRAVEETAFRLLKEGLRDSFYTIDAAAVADGRYVVKVVATDAAGNPYNAALAGERVSEPFDIDNTAPVITLTAPPTVAGERVRLTFDAEDRNGRLRLAEFSLDAGAWRDLAPADGITDGPRERYTIELPLTGAGEHVIALRAADANGNVGIVRVPVRK